MKLKITLFLPISLILSSCFGPRDTNHKAVWNEQGNELKKLVRQIKSNGAYERGNHDFPDTFEYPFNDGFHLCFGYDSTGKAIQSDNKNLMIQFYTDRGLMDHFSAFIYANNKMQMEQLDEQTQQEKNDKDIKLEEHWYYIQD